MTMLQKSASPFPPGPWRCTRFGAALLAVLLFSSGCAGCAVTSVAPSEESVTGPQL